MKLVFTLFIFILSYNVQANEAVCIALEAPMLLKPDLSSIVSQVLRKGETVKIRGRNVGVGPLEISYSDETDKPYFPTDSKGNEYLESVDRAGRNVYIPKKFMRIIFKDKRERSVSLSDDTTDYRIYEPIDDKYPFYQYKKRKLYWTYGLGSTHQANYRYPKRILNESISSRHQIDVAFVKKVEKDPLDRFYYGGYIHLYGDESTYFLEDSVIAKELRGQFGIGPTLSYEFFKRQHIGMTFWGALTVNYDRMFINQTDGANTEERIYQAFTLTPKFGTFLQIKDVLPFGDITMGAQMQMNYEYSLESSSDIVIEDYWRETDDTYIYPYGGIFTFYIGILTSV